MPVQKMTRLANTIQKGRARRPRRRSKSSGAARTLLIMNFLLLICMGLPNLIEGDFIDMDTPLDKRTTTSLIDGTVYHLVRFAALLSVSRSICLHQTYIFFFFYLFIGTVSSCVFLP
jgi:hypothetical protein